MMRPKKQRHINFDPEVTFFKPQGVPLKEIEEVEISHAEIEAIRLKNVEGLDQHACAEKMRISQSTFQRLLVLANQKIAEALIGGKAIKIENKSGSKK